VQPVATGPVDAATNLRRSVFVATGLGLASIVVLALFGHELMGVFGCIGLALGAINNRMLQQSVVRYASSESRRKAGFARKMMLRLALVTAVAALLGLLIRPDGLGVFVGLAVFQVLMLVGATVPVFRSLRHS
jgi:hypothetical protein